MINKVFDAIPCPESFRLRLLVFLFIVIPVVLLLSTIIFLGLVLWVIGIPIMFIAAFLFNLEELFCEYLEFEVPPFSWIN